MKPHFSNAHSRKPSHHKQGLKHPDFGNLTETSHTTNPITSQLASIVPPQVNDQETSTRVPFKEAKGVIQAMNKHVKEPRKNEKPRKKLHSRDNSLLTEEERINKSSICSSPKRAEDKEFKLKEIKDEKP